MEHDEAAASIPTLSHNNPAEVSGDHAHLNGHSNTSAEGQFAGSSQVLSHSPPRIREGGSASKALLVQLSLARAQIHELQQTIGQKDELIEKERQRREKLVADHKWELAKKDVELANLRRQMVGTQDGASSSSGVTDAERLLEMEKELQARDALIARLMMSNNSS
ncbi:hypothetical protein AAVH_05380 [Aphelenchoides avenae]|nr:hypothetical protein AAVH_05380 [Aphelenchus avenae]